MDENPDGSGGAGQRYQGRGRGGGGRGQNHNNAGRGRGGGGGGNNQRGGGRGRGNRGNNRGQGQGRVPPPNNIGNLADQMERLMNINPFPGVDGNQGGDNGGGEGNRGWGRGRHGNRGRGNTNRNAVNVGAAANLNEIEDSDGSNDSVVPRKQKKKFEGPVFGFKRLYGFLTTDPNDVLISINKDKDDWQALLESEDLTGEKLIVAIQVLGEKVCVDVPILRQAQANVLTACCSKEFVKKLEDAIPKISLGTFLPPRRGRNAANNEMPVDGSLVKVATNVYQLCSFVLKTMPSSAVDLFSTLIVSTFGICSSSSNPDIELCSNFKTLHRELIDAIEKEKKKETRKCRYTGFDDEAMEEFDDETPPEDIADIDIIPSIDELRRTVETFLRPNKKSGSYRSSVHYLDVQFRLLREDFVQPLRNGIRTFMKDRHEYITGKKKLPLGEVRLYTNVRVLKVEKERDSVVYKLQLPEKTYKRIKWDKSKRLLVGSLILLTTVDNCFQTNTTQFGVVFSRNIRELEKGIMTVTWEGSPPCYDEEEEYLMFESEVYLEAYRYTLDTLKKLELDNFPMKKFIVDACSEVDMPKYLKDSTKLMELKLANGSSTYVSPQNSQWPTPLEFGLDENQFLAYKTALSKEFTIIQGPPGTGKTFLGLKVAEVLLSNSELWTTGEQNPITVVCYTNHALDQFLEGILKYYQREEIEPDIIRIGGRCKSETLAKYTLREPHYRKRRKLGPGYYAAERQAREEIDELEDQRARGMSEITGLQDVQGIVNFERLSTWNQLQPNYPKALWNNFQNFKWLGISNDDLNVENFYEDAVARRWFEVRHFPKSAPKKKNQTNEQAQRVERMDVDGGNGEDSDDEDYDLDELMENRVLDDIILEAETSGRVGMGRHISYLPNGSSIGCEKSFKQLNHQLREATKGLNMAETMQIRNTKRDELQVLENRQKLLAEIFKLYKEQLLELPDVSDLFIEIRRNGTVHYNRLLFSERWALYFAMVDIARQSVAEHVADIERQRGIAQKALRDLMQHGDGMILRDCKVVGLTTTGAAKYNNLLRMMQSKIVMVEEAAEVFEAHIVTCITEKCEQLILIGDHQQLRPSPTVYNLATKFNLDLSLFERMLNNKLHCHQIKVQHRMRPEISNLIMGPIYKELYNHESVKVYPDVKGVTKNVFFLSHKEFESAEKDSMSKSNAHEAKFIAALCRHLKLQGYESDQITILTMYMGQMFLLKKEVSKTCQGVRITCVDNFQGEENDIILLSLVRSNTQGNIGFLKIDNRICVSLSRAKQGLFVIGNMDAMMASKTWAAIKEKLDAEDAVGDSLELECEIHRTRSRVKNPQDFIKVAPEGGCSLLCDATLPCSHKCPKVCHVVDKEHKNFVCHQPCLQVCTNKLHPCKGRCFEKCPPCTVRMEKTLNCELQHKRIMMCHQKVDDVICVERVEKTLPCSHKEQLACHISIHSYKCKVKVDKLLPCTHTKKDVECHVDSTSIKCRIVVAKTLPCEHVQQEECWKDAESIRCDTMVPKKFLKCGHETQVKCYKKNEPAACRSHCTTRLKCGHACTKICHIDEDPDHLLYECKKECSRQCEFGHQCKTKHHCFKDCPPCKSKIVRTLPCEHEAELPCAEDVNLYECLQRCERLLGQCRHQCPNLCHQPCGPCDMMVTRRAECGHEQIVLCGTVALKSNCEKLVPPRKIPACGHRDALVPCKIDQGSPEELAKFCQRPCNYKFERAAGNGCEHQCGGTCSACFQGRIHMKCQAECGRQLVCGHVCEVNCSAVCPPCQKPCLMKCEHSECTQQCGKPCSDCKEKCSWRCPHKECTKRCGEMCDREACDEPCQKKLKCGHQCVGFCGEPCPPLCRECDKEELTEVFFGNEDEEDARFVFLPDCGHTIEKDGLEYWLTNMGDGQITSKRCPKCKAAIRNCRRFGNLIRQHYQDVIKVKMRSFGNKANSERMRNGWISNLGEGCQMSRVFPQVHTKIRAFLVKEVTGANGRTQLIRNTVDEFSMRSMDFIADSANKAAGELLTLRKKDLASPHYEKVVTVYRKTFEWMLGRQPLSRQEFIDFNKELDRIDYYKQLMIRRSLPNCNPQNGTAYATYTLCKGLVTSTMPFTEERKEKFKRHLKELDDLLKSGLGISDRERKEILQAMGMGQGHWFKCPKGHVYVITECGGAMQEGKCNECGARIGGDSHRLRSDNQLATEMDGATRGAWPNTVQQLQRFV